VPGDVVLLAGAPVSRLTQRRLNLFTGVRVLGQSSPWTHESIEIQTKAGVVSLDIRHPSDLSAVPSDLSHVTSDHTWVLRRRSSHRERRWQNRSSYFQPSCARGRSSVLLDRRWSGDTSRMTNGTVSRPPLPNRSLAWTNGVAQRAGGTTLVVRYQDGTQTISCCECSVTQVLRATETGAGDAVYAVTVPQANGKLGTSKFRHLRTGPRKPIDAESPPCVHHATR